MHHTNRDPFHCPLHILKRTALLVARLGPEAADVSAAAGRYFHIILISLPSTRRQGARVIGKDIQMAEGLFSDPRLDVNVCLREWKGQESLAGVGFINADID